MVFGSADRMVYTGFPLFYWQKIQDFSRTTWEIFQDLFGAHKSLNIMKKPSPSPPDPCPPPSLPLEVGPFKSRYGIWGSTVSSLSVGFGADPQPKSNLVHFSLKIWHLVATILTILLRINWQNLVLEMREISVMRNFQGYFSRTLQDLKLHFPGLSRTKVIFQDFPGPGNLKKKIQDFPGFSKRRGNPVNKYVRENSVRGVIRSVTI